MSDGQATEPPDDEFMGEVHYRFQRAKVISSHPMKYRNFKLVVFTTINHWLRTNQTVSIAEIIQTVASLPTKNQKRGNQLKVVASPEDFLFIMVKYVKQKKFLEHGCKLISIDFDPDLSKTRLTLVN